MYAKVREHGAPVQGARLGGGAGKAVGACTGALARTYAMKKYFRNLKEMSTHEKKSFSPFPGGHRNCRRRARTARLCCSSPQDEDHAGTSLLASASQSAIQPERCGGDNRNRRGNHWHRRRWREGHDIAVCRETDRPGPAVYRASVAGHESRLLLSRRPGED